MAHDTNVLVPEKGELYALLTKAEKTLDQVNSRSEELEKRGRILADDLETARAQAKLTEELKSQVAAQQETITKEREELTALKAEATELKTRCDILDKNFARGSKIYTSEAIPGLIPGLKMTYQQREALQDYGRFCHDALMLWSGRQPQFGMITRDQKIGDNTKGGHAVPRPLYDGVVALTPQMGFARQFCSVIEMTSETLDVPTASTYPTVSWPGENVAPADSTQLLDDPRKRLTAKKLVATNLMSMEIREDATPGYLQFIGTRFLQAMTLEEDRQALSASVDPFTGVLYESGVGEATLTTGSTSFSMFSYTDIVNLVDAAAEEIFTDGDGGGRFVMNRQVLHGTRKLLDDNGNPIFAPMMVGTPATILGYNWSTSTKMPRQATAQNVAGKPFMAYGDWSYAWLGDRHAMEVGYSEHVKFGESQIMMRVQERIAFLIIIARAFSRLVSLT